MNNLGYDIDYIHVGNGEKGGDAIALRWGNLTTEPKWQKVVVIDGGFSDSGDLLVDHIRKYYGTDTVDLVISTHPDSDHISGLTNVLENMKVGEILMHQPWKHTGGISDAFKDGRVTDNSIKDALKESLEQALTIEQLASKKGIRITEPFVGVTCFGGAMRIIGPTINYYEELLPDFRGTPESKDSSVLNTIFQGAASVVHKIAEDFNIETLDDNGETSAENNSSTIILFTISDECLLFTGDAGIPALAQAIELLENEGFDFNRIKFIDVPHHGSRRNVGPSVLDKIVGPKQAHDQKRKTAFVSAPISSSKHPSKKVMNAFRRRGAHVFTTNGQTIHHLKNSPDRPGWTSIEPIPFHNEVEE